ncbi:MAG TPA: ATP-binding protein [Nocardioides sp.]|nr:ATP-binding protein [Nocardioides sp.]
MSGQYVATGFAVPAGLDTLHALVEQVARDHPDVAPADLMMFETAVVEIAGNVVEHVGGEGLTTWNLTLAITSTELRGTLADNGSSFEGDLTGTTLPEDPLAESGRGIALARSALDELEYSRVGDTNHWLMVRARTDVTG